MYKIFIDALLDSARMIPLLLIIYVGIELIEYKLGDNLISRVKQAGKVAPAMGALFGLIPQCGFSVMATALYTKRALTLGTLLAVYISTSDEALPIILAQPNKASILIPLLTTKLIIALITGYSIDFLLNRRLNDPAQGELCATSENLNPSIPYNVETMDTSINEIIDEKGCCSHTINPKKIDWKEIIYHPTVHTLKVFIFIFVASLIINLLIFQIGDGNLSRVFLRNTLFQPIITSIFGLIPNCASSVAITELFLKGGLSFGSTIAGLSTSAGLGLLVLLKENKNRKETLKIILLLTSISSIVGIIIQYIYG